uniref:Nuclear pore protein n=1 Tax=Tetraselmis sp. GSL018 TaxID=582737 RepID=A0A061SE68_9CHLO
MKPSYEDVFQVETASVSEYLKQVHDMTLLTSIQQAQRDSVSAFDDFMDQCMEMDWAADKRELFEAILPAGISSQSRGAPVSASSPTAGLMSVDRQTPASQRTRARMRGTPSALVTPFASGTPHAPRSIGAGDVQPELEPRAQVYLGVVREMHSAKAQQQQFNAVAAFGKALDSVAEVKQGARAASVRDLWTLLLRMVEQAEGARGIVSDPDAAQRSALLIGARQHLEAGHSNYIRAVIQRNVGTARLGGSPSRLEHVRAFLRVMLKDEGQLDFDRGSVPTTWRQLHFCIRSGFYDEAKQVAATVTDFRAGDFTQAQFQSALSAWLQSGVVPDGNLSTQLQVECQKLLADRGRPASNISELRQKLLLLTVLSGDREAADQLLRDAPQLFPTIEDFMWFRIAAIRETGASSLPGLSTGRRAYTLSDLQQYLGKYPASHYSKDGKEPLLYAVVLLLSLQFRQAVSFLAKDPSTHAHRIDAIHIAAALVHHDLADAGGSSDAGARGRGVDFGALLHDYAQAFVKDHPHTALEYYMLAATATAGQHNQPAALKARGVMLRELLLLSGDMSLVAPGGPLSKFVPDAASREELLSQVAYECQVAAQLDEAVELYMEARRPVPALAIINQRISGLLDEEARSAAAGKEVEDLILRGRDAKDRVGPFPGSVQERREVEAFDQLLHIREVVQLSAQEKHAAAIQKLSELPFVPLEMHRVEKCVADVGALHQVVAERVPQLLLAAAQSLRLQFEASGRHSDLRGQLEAIRSFAGNTGIHYKFPTSTYQALARLCVV